MQPDLQEPVNAARAMRGNTAGLLAGQDLKTEGFLGKFTDTINKQGTTEALATRIGEELGLPTLQKNAFNLQQQMYDIPSTYSAATRGFDVNANQLSRIIGQKQTELGPTAQRATDQAQFAQGQLSTRLGYAQNDWARQLLPLNSEQAFLTDRMARETSLYTQDNQNELNAILAKMQGGITLSEGEKSRANALAIAEKGYENALKVATMNNQQKKESPFITVGEGSSIFNTSTGKSMYTAPKSYAPSQYNNSGNGW